MLSQGHKVINNWRVIKTNTLFVTTPRNFLPLHWKSGSDMNSFHVIRYGKILKVRCHSPIPKPLLCPGLGLTMHGVSHSGFIHLVTQESKGAATTCDQKLAVYISMTLFSMHHLHILTKTYECKKTFKET